MTPPRTDHAIVYAASSPDNRRSAVTFDVTHALVPASVLIGALSSSEGSRLTGTLLSDQLVDAQTGNWAELRSLTLRLVHKSMSDGSLRTTEARVLYVFNCGNITDAVIRLLDGFEPPRINTELFGLGQLALSAFVVLQVQVGDSVHSANSLIQLFQLAASREKHSSIIHFQPLNRLDRIATVTTPFSNEVFFGSINVGSVANVFGRHDCVFVASQLLVAGCEGGAVYNKRLELTGVIIATTFRWKNTENASMTLVASFAEIVGEFLRQSELGANLRVERTALSVTEAHVHFERSVLMIEVGGSSGTGCFVRVNNERFILTCAHVVANLKSAKSPITCTWHGGTFTTHLLYKNPLFGCAYDVALLHAPDANTVPDDYFARCSPAMPAVGQRVYATGFPHFVALARQQFAPSVLAGRITRVAEHIVCTDTSIQAGQSGGPLIGDDGAVVGVMVCNTREPSNGQIYPNVNMCIPIGAIAGIIAEYVDCLDVAVLDRLVASIDVVRSWNLQTGLSLSKL